MPRDVVAMLGGDDLAHSVLASTFNFHPLNAPVGTIPGDVLRDLGNGNPQAGRRVLEKFIHLTRKQYAAARKQARVMTTENSQP